jgi:hypothetical protein
MQRNSDECPKRKKSTPGGEESISISTGPPTCRAPPNLHYQKSVGSVIVFPKKIANMKRVGADRQCKKEFRAPVNVKTNLHSLLLS